MNLFLRLSIVVFSLVFGSGCETAYFNTMEKVGIHKRDILIDRIESTQSAQKDAQEEFMSALDHLRTIHDFDGSPFT